jgi:hypothetical protein
MSSNKIDNDLEKYRPWIETRLDANVQPKHKLLSRQLHLKSEPTLTIHTAGQNVVWELPIREAVKDNNLLENMDQSDRALVKWIVENDLDVDQYCYKKS